MECSPGSANGAALDGLLEAHHLVMANPTALLENRRPEGESRGEREK